MTGIETAIAIAAVAASAGGTLMSGFQQAAAQKASARAADEAARSELMAGMSESNSLRRRAAVETGGQIANAAGSGLMLEGSPIDVIFQNAANMELDAMTAMSNREGRANAYKTEAAGLRSAARTTRTNAIIGAGTQLLFGAAGPTGSYMGGTGTNPMTGLRF